MRISDWSSDVCSSDLRLAIRPRLHEEAVACGGVAVIGRIENLPLKIEAKRLDGFQPGAEIRALLALDRFAGPGVDRSPRSEEHTSELQSLMRISYAVFCLKKKKTHNKQYHRAPIS